MAGSVMTWKTKWWFSPFLIAGSTLAQTAFLLFALRSLFPHLWAQQLHSGIFANIAMFLAISFFQAIVEWVGHRYFMHVHTVSFIGGFSGPVSFSHGKHHALTHISVIDADARGTMKKIVSGYVVAEEKQHYAVTFGEYFLPAFFVGYNILFLVFHFLIPGAPFFLGGNLAIAVWIALYDILHQLEHKPDAWWEKRKYNPILTMIYRFHQYHHLSASATKEFTPLLPCNMAIVGFLGIPIVDWLLRTYKLPPYALHDGDIIPVELLRPPETFQLIKKLDAMALARERRLLSKPRVSLQTQ